jgi:hypothetical protein
MLNKVYKCLMVVAVTSFCDVMAKKSGIRVNVEKRYPNYNLNFTHDESSDKSKLQQVHEHLKNVAG